MNAPDPTPALRDSISLVYRCNVKRSHLP